MFLFKNFFKIAVVDFIFNTLFYKDKNTSITAKNASFFNKLLPITLQG